MPQLEAQEWKYRNGHISEAKFLLNGPTSFSKVRAHGVLHFQKKIPKILKNKMSAGRLTSCFHWARKGWKCPIAQKKTSCLLLVISVTLQLPEPEVFLPCGKACLRCFLLFPLQLSLPLYPLNPVSIYSLTSYQVSTVSLSYDIQECGATDSLWIFG